MLLVLNPSKNEIDFCRCSLKKNVNWQPYSLLEGISNRYQQNVLIDMYEESDGIEDKYIILDQFYLFDEHINALNDVRDVHSRLTLLNAYDPCKFVYNGDTVYPDTFQRTSVV